MSDSLPCIASSDPYLVGKRMSRTSLILEGYTYQYVKDRLVHLFTRRNQYIELSLLTLEEGLQLLEQGN